MSLFKFGLLVAVLIVLSILFKSGKSEESEPIQAPQNENVLQNTLNAAHKAADSLSR